ncbi:MAG TPA: PAS domain S-box protein [Aliidongia sp.]|uniref:hybrid sensor histidine kinase/response regulator n=1 Tax=Aliidongia sp. TaxID=1914230 RepID=UPI002DDD5B18|nr:PAS domain S-box protein [Aliidongia sp.]HEV2675195.1 PAS domain S-box protein [Aliidongia sp.]
MERVERFSAAQSEDGRYRLLVEAVTDYAIYMLDPDGRVTSWNAGARRFKGYEPAEIIGSHFSQFYTAADRASGLPARALATAESEGKFEGEGWRVRKDGTEFWAQVVIDPIRASTGELVGYAKITRDLTERRKAEETLRQSQEQFRILVQGVTDYAIYMLDPTGRISSWNQGAQRIKGYLPDEIIGEHFSRFYMPEDHAAGEPERALRTALAEGRYEKEGWRVRKDGSRFWASVIIDPIRTEDGRLLGYAKVTRDITTQRDARRALDQAREALFQSQKMEAIGQLTGGVAHDFNNLLMAIQSGLELLSRRAPDDPRNPSLLQNALAATHRGAALVQRMLAFARRQELKPEAIDVSTLVDGMTDLLQRSLGSSIQVDARFPSSMRPVLADHNQLELALLNLAVNARDAMPDGGSILISGTEVEVVEGDARGLSPGQYVSLSLIDTGTGMDEATLSRALDPFFTTKGVGKGTGLGLPMVMGLAAQSGGRLFLESRLGQGTTAELLLPVASGHVRPVADRRLDSDEPARPAMRPLDILLVDDDPLIVINTSAMLEELGHRVREAVSGDQALEILDHAPPFDLVITDQAMPGMTGWQLSEEIRSRWPGLRVILATGYAELAPGAGTGLLRLSKPFSQRDLTDAIAGAMAKA